MADRKKRNRNLLRTVWLAGVPDHVQALVWHPRATCVAAAAVSGPITVFAAADGKPIASWPGHNFGTVALAFDPAGQLLASVGQDGKIYLTDTTLWQQRAALDGGSAWVEHLAFRPDGKRLATAAGRSLRIWDPTTGELLHESKDFPATISTLAWQPNSPTHTLAVGVYGGVKLFDTEPLNVQKTLVWKGAPLVVAWSPDGKVLAHGNQDASVHFWDIAANDDSPLQMSGYAAKVRHLAWDYSSRFLATGGAPDVCIWDCSGSGPAGSKPKLLTAHEEPITALAYQHHGFLMASGGSEGRINLWQPTAKKDPHTGELPIDNEIVALAFSPNDTTLAAGTAAGDVLLCKW